MRYVNVEPLYVKCGKCEMQTKFFGADQPASIARCNNCQEPFKESYLVNVLTLAIRELQNR